MGHHPEPTEQHDLFYCPMAARWIGVREKLEEKAENLEEILYFMEKRKTSFPVDFLLNQSSYSYCDGRLGVCDQNLGVNVS